MDVPDVALDDITNTTALMERTLNPEMADDDEEESVLPYLVEFFGLFVQFNGDWAYFVQEMLDATSQDYGHTSTGDENDNSLSSTVINKENQLGVFTKTDLLVQTALSPTGRMRVASVNGTRANSTEEGLDHAIYFGPSGAEDALYTVALSSAYTVNVTYAGFQYSTFDTESSSQVKLQTGTTDGLDFDFNDWGDFFLYPGSLASALDISLNRDNGPQASISSADVIVPTDNTEATTTSGFMPDAFGGGASTLGQVAATTSAAVGTASPAIPSTFAQAMSQPRANIRNMPGADSLAKLLAFDIAVKSLYNAPVLDNVAVCAQWPNPCEKNDGWFVDGGFVDNPSVAINVAQYHQRADANLTKTLKMVLTNTNQKWNSTYVEAQLLQYYACDFNDGIAPGEYIWIPSSQVPRRSAQFLGETLDSTQLNALIEPIDGSNMTTAVLRGTTIDNPAFGIYEGQKIEILLLNLNTPITTFIAGASIINLTMEPLADMTRAIAANKDMLKRVQMFFGLTESGEGSGSEDGENSGGDQSSGSTEASTSYSSLQPSLLGFFIGVLTQSAALT